MMNAVRQLGSEGFHIVQGRVIAIIYCANQLSSTIPEKIISGF